MKTKRAFTLLELLVVVFIIAVLAALLLPALARGRAAAWNVACKNNLRQIGIGLHLYVNDFRAYPVYIVGYGPRTQAWWSTRLKPYTHAKAPQFYTGDLPSLTNLIKGIYFCPAFANMAPGWPTITYGYNVNGCGIPLQQAWWLGIGGQRLVPDDAGAVGERAWRPIREQEVVRPSDMIAVGDSWLEDLPWYGMTYPSPYLNEPLHVGDMPNVNLGAASTHPLEQRHSGRFNVLFCDTHIEYTRWRLLYQWQDDKLRRWNNDNLPHRDALPHP